MGTAVVLCEIDGYSRTTRLAYVACVLCKFNSIFVLVIGLIVVAAGIDMWANVWVFSSVCMYVYMYMYVCIYVSGCV